jgi:hypothetical protein
MIEKEQLVPLENPEDQQELLPQGERREGCGEEKPWIIPITSTVHTNGAPQSNTFPCAPSEAECILRKNIREIIKLFLDKQFPGNRQPQQIMLYRRMRLVCNKKLEDMNHDELIQVWIWVKKEYGETESENIIGKKYGRWTVVEFAYRKNYLVYYNCRCECGSIRVVNLDNLKSGKTYSCGCYNKERASKTKKEHGMTNSRIYTIWSRMKSLCCNEANKSYKNYGGKGISVCDEWANKFEKFFAWAQVNGYQDSLCLTRIDKSKGYSPENCKFASRFESMKGKSNGKRSISMRSQK